MTETDKDAADEKFKALYKTIPLARAGRHEEIASTLLMLGSPAGGYYNAVTLTIDGGHLVRSTLANEAMDPEQELMIRRPPTYRSWRAPRTKTRRHPAQLMTLYPWTGLVEDSGHECVKSRKVKVAASRSRSRQARARLPSLSTATLVPSLAPF